MKYLEIEKNCLNMHHYAFFYFLLLVPAFCPVFGQV